MQLTIGRATHEKLRHAQALLSHKIPSGDLATVLDLALDALIAQLEKRKIAATEKPRPRRRRGPGNPRHIPAHVKRAVWERDGGQCTYVSETGRRCSARRLLEYDHVEPVARGGQATVAGVRLRCRMHNQFEAERAFGAGFMEEKREAARRAAAARREAAGRTRAAAGDKGEDLRAALRQLGFRAEQVRRAAEFCATLSDATLEECVRAALRFLCPNRGTRTSTRSGTSWPVEALTGSGCDGGIGTWPGAPA